MLDALSTLVSTVTSLVTFVINAIGSFLNLLVKLPSYLLFITNSVALMPMILIPFVTAAVSIYVVLFMIGRN